MKLLARLFNRHSKESAAAAETLAEGEVRLEAAARQGDPVARFMELGGLLADTYTAQLDRTFGQIGSDTFYGNMLKSSGIFAAAGVVCAVLLTSLPLGAAVMAGLFGGFVVGTVAEVVRLEVSSRLDPVKKGLEKLTGRVEEALSATEKLVPQGALEQSPGYGAFRAKYPEVAEAFAEEAAKKHTAQTPPLSEPALRAAKLSL